MPPAATSHLDDVDRTGVWPLVSSKGAGAEMRHAMGVAVFAGMIGVTVFCLFLTPAFFVTLRGRRAHKTTPAREPAPHEPVYAPAE